MFRKAGLMFFLLIITSCGASTDLRHENMATLKERWDQANEPIRMLPSDYEVVFQSLPLSGQLDRQPWTDSYWPSYRGGLAARWRDDISGHDVNPVTFDQARLMEPAQLSRLSPAEKFDLFVGDDSFTLFNSEIKRTSPDDEAWFGICHGWAPASLAFKEPKAITLTGANGLAIPFGSSDIKALLSLYSADYAQVKSWMLAARCNDDFAKNPEAENKPGCRDTNAGAFHLVLANLIGIKKRGFVADLTRDIEVWNQPIAGFSTKVLSESRGRSRGASFWTVREVTVETTIQYGAEISPEWASVGSKMMTRTYNYRLEINRRGMIIGGAWLSEQRPDFLWTNSTPKFEDGSNRRAGDKVIKWSELSKIYEAATTAESDAPEL